MKHIRIIAPLVLSDRAMKKQYIESNHLFEQEGLKISSVFLDRGPQQIESRIDEALLIPDLICKAIDAEKEGVDGILIDCMADPGVDVVRECVSIPVIGPGRISMQIASVLGRKFSILTAGEEASKNFQDEVKSYGLKHCFSSCRSTVGLDVYEASDDLIVEKLSDAAKAAVHKDSADVLVLGCTRFSDLSNKLTDELVSQRLLVPIINPTLVAINMLAGLLSAGLSHSKTAYPYPLKMDAIGLNIPEINALC